MNRRKDMTDNHAYTLGFSLSRKREDGDVSGAQLRQAIHARLADLDDDEIVETCGAPFGTDENDAVTPTCAEHAAWAERAVHAYARVKEGRVYDPVVDVASDLMADLCHLLVKEGSLPDLVLERAKNHCQDECAEEGIVI
jgi:hypothetical protein